LKREEREYKMYGVMLGSVTIGFVFSIVNMLLIPLLKESFTPAISGFIVSAGMLLAAAAGPLIGLWSDRIGKRLPFIGGLVVLSFSGTLLPILNNSVASACGGVILAFCAYSFLGPYSSLVADRAGASGANRGFGAVMGAVNVSGFAASLVINRLYEVGTDITLLALSAGVLLPFIFPLLSAPRHEHLERPDSIEKMTLRAVVEILSKPLLFFFSMQFFAWFSIGGLFPFLTSFLSSETSMSLSTAATWFGGSTLLSGITSFFTATAAKAFGEKRLLVVSLSVIASIGCLYSALYGRLLSGTGAGYAGVSVFLLSSLGLGFYYSLSSATLAKLVEPHKRGVAFGINSIFMILSQAVSVALMGGLISAWGYHGMILVCTVGFVLAALSASRIS
jgi:MFS family permease